jgi:glutamate racemase
VEAATQTPWSQTVPTFPQAYNRDVIGLFATSATVESGVYAEEIAKRCPSVRMVAQGCPALVPLLERGASPTELHVAVHGYVQQLLAKCAALEANLVPNLAILGCTHYPLIKPLFMQALPPSVRVFDQPQAVADALDDYLTRHPEFATPHQSVGPAGGGVRYYTTGEAAQVQRIASLLLKQAIEFSSLT